MCYVTWHSGIKVADWIKVDNQLTLKKEIVLDYLGGPTEIISIF